jgi:hypothetical protein
MSALERYQATKLELNRLFTDTDRNLDRPPAMMG